MFLVGVWNDQTIANIKIPRNIVNDVWHKNVMKYAENVYIWSYFAKCTFQLNLEKIEGAMKNKQYGTIHNIEHTEHRVNYNKIEILKK